MNTMTPLGFASLLALSLATAGSAHAAPSWTQVATDTLTFNDDIVAFTTDNWGACAENTSCTTTGNNGTSTTIPSPSAYLTYRVFYDIGTYNGADAYKWRYEYSWFGFSKDLSHLIIEVSPGLTAADILEATDSNNGGLGSYGPSTNGKSNPGMPLEMYGYKWNTPDGDSVSYSVFIETWRAPMWGDFYAVDGKKTDEKVYAFNTGFAGQTNGSEFDPALDVTTLLGRLTGGAFTYQYDHIMRPDTVVRKPDDGERPANIPEPSTVVLIGLGLLGVGLSRRRRP